MKMWPAVAGLAALVLSGCTSDQVSQWGRLGLPKPASDRSPYVHHLWVGAWIAAFAVGALVWGLIVWCVVRYRRRKPGVPRQTRYNLPIEVFFTVTPFVVVGVLFYYTVVTQDKVRATVDKPDHVVTVVAQKWNWTFNYMESGNPRVNKAVYDTGTIDRPADLYLPKGESVRFNLRSVDVIHSFWVPAFYEKLDIVPGRNNGFDMTPTKTGTFSGKCAEFCGTYHSRMLFTLHVVPKQEYYHHLKKLKAKGNTGKVSIASKANSVPQLHGHQPKKNLYGKNSNENVHKNKNGR